MNWTREQIEENCYECLLFKDQDATNKYLRDNWAPTITSLTLNYISGILLAFMGFFILWNRKFKDHPYWMLACTCLMISMVQLN